MSVRSETFSDENYLISVELLVERIVLDIIVYLRPDMKLTQQTLRDASYTFVVHLWSRPALHERIFIVNPSSEKCIYVDKRYIVLSRPIFGTIVSLVTDHCDDYNTSNFAAGNIGKHILVIVEQYVSSRR